MKDLSQLKVCFLAGTLDQGGAERQLFYILHALRQRGVVPRLLSLGRDEFWENRIKDLGVPVIPLGRGTSKLGRLVGLLAALRRDRPWILQSQHFYTNAYAGVAARLCGVVSIGALRSNGLMEVRDCGRAGGWLNLHTPHVLAGNSESGLRYAEGRGVSPVRLFHLTNVADTTAFSPAAARCSGPVRLLAVGRLIPSKRFDRFVSVIARLRRTLCCEVNGVIAGDGPLKNELRAQASALGLPPSALELRGSVADLAPVYREADVFVMTSEFEGTPNVLLEAMASGLPVVATNVGGVPEIVRHGQNGFLVDGADGEALRAALAHLIVAPHLRASVGQCGRAYVLANHSLERLPFLLGELYGLALANARDRVAGAAVLSHAG